MPSSKDYRKAYPKKYKGMWLTALISSAAFLITWFILRKQCGEDSIWPFLTVCVFMIVCIGGCMRSQLNRINAYQKAFPKATYWEYMVPCFVIGHPEINIWVFNLIKWFLTLIICFFIMIAFHFSDTSFALR